ncbi:MAG: YciI family protein [Gammaproteobacteria bacterium]|nr:YciI family protein [Gammaproteobacteria bacterium]MDE0252714.1 YciI family protein [Gammaproteobacteria bacterium]MDE0402402.1 YciI family protein [Gammaproteobacteria bacterium]
MFFIVNTSHKPGRVKTGSDEQLAFADFLRNHPDHPDVIVHNAGPTHERDFDTADGFLLIVEAPSLDAVRAFVDDSSYCKAGTLSDVQIRMWDWRTGRPD